MPKLTDREVYAMREGWVDSLDWVLEVLNEEIDYQEQRWPHPDESVKILERIHTIVSSRRKEWMLSGS